MRHWIVSAALVLISTSFAIAQAPEPTRVLVALRQRVPPEHDGVVEQRSCPFLDPVHLREEVRVLRSEPLVDLHDARLSGRVRVARSGKRGHEARFAAGQHFLKQPDVTPAVFGLRIEQNRVKIDLVRKGEMLSADDVTDILAVKLIGIVPDDESVVSASNSGNPVTLNEASRSGQAFRNIARRLCGGRKRKL